MGKAIALELQQVNYHVAERHLLHDINISIEQQSTTALLGYNGAGKSLLLKLCHGLLAPSSGTAINHYSSDKQAMVFQKPIMLRRSVEGNIQYVLKIKKTANRQIESLIEEALNSADLAKVRQQPARKLSIGQQQRLAISRACILKPELLLLDEPTDSLDYSAMQKVEAMIQEIRNQGATVVMSTHDFNQAKRLADYIIFIHQGRILEHTPADVFFTAPQTKQAEAFLTGELI